MEPNSVWSLKRRIFSLEKGMYKSHKTMGVMGKANVEWLLTDPSVRALEDTWEISLNTAR